MSTVPCSIIGHVRSDYTDPSLTPVQAALNLSSQATIEIDPGYVEALYALQEFDYLWIISLIGDPLNRPQSMKEIPHLLAEVPRLIGGLATRGPGRPNPLGLSLVKLEGVERNLVRFSGVDLIDGTPVIDVKPFVTRFDVPRGEPRNGWYDEVEIADGTIPGTGGRPKYKLSAEPTPDR